MSVPQAEFANVANGNSRVDPALVAVTRGYLEATSREMGGSLTRNAASPIFIEGQDFSCAVLDSKRELVSAANFDPSHLCSMAFSVDWAVMERAEELIDGDVIVVNDPYRGGTHVPDVTMFSPVSVSGVLVGYAVTRAHHLDIGGMAPGSVPAGARDVFAEGLRIPPSYWEKAGLEVPETVDWIMSNVRLPGTELSDFRAQVASLRTGQRRIRELCERYGVSVVIAAMDAIKDQSEFEMRRFLESIPDGKYRGTDLLDGDGNTPDRYRIQVSVAIKAGAAVIDFTGSSLQADGPINLPFASTASAVYSAMIPLAGTELAFNHGCFRPISFRAPRGSIVNAQPPAPTFGCTTDTPLHVIEAILAALADAIPDRVIAGSYATCNILAGAGIDDQADPFLFWFFFAGGWGAAVERDGWNCTPNQSANFRDYPVEIIESHFPLRCDAITLLTDSGGAGRYRGGLGTAHEYTFLSRTTVSGFGDRHEFRPAGRCDGDAGAPSRFLIQRSSDDDWVGVEEATGQPSKFSNLVFEVGDRLRVENGGGGGYGPAAQRTSNAVRDDVRAGVVSVEHAKSTYGVGVTSSEAAGLSPRPNSFAHPLRSSDDVGRVDEETIRDPAVPDDLASSVNLVVTAHAADVCKARCPLAADPLRCPYHHPYATAFWPVDTLSAWTEHHCLLQRELLPILSGDAR